MKHLKNNDDNFFLFEDDENIENTTPSVVPQHSLTADEITSQPKISFGGSVSGNGSPLEALKKRMTEKVQPEAKETKPEKTENPQGRKQNGKSLLEKCMPYIVDDNGNTAKEPPSYKLDSVSDILKSQSQRTIETLSKKYEITFDDLGKYDIPPEPKKETADPVPEKAEQHKEPQNIFEKQIFEDILAAKMPVKNIQTNLPDISDIDNFTAAKADELPNGDFEKGTIRFTPVHDTDSAEGRISISSQTRPIDLTGEFSQVLNSEDETEETQLEETEFDEYIPKEEYTSPEETKHFFRRFAIKKRNSFLKLVFSIIITLILAVFRLPAFSPLLVSSTTVCMIVCAALLLIETAVNFDMFKAFAKLFSRHSAPEANAALASIAVFAYVGYGFYKNEITLDLMILLGLIYVFLAISRFMKDSYMLSNFKQISTSAPKRAVRLLDDNAVTFAMAKDAVEGDALIAAPQRTGRIDGYMKYATFGVFMNGKLPLITILSAVLAVIVGLACAAYYNGVIYGFYSAAVIMCLASLPTLFLIDRLPLFSAAKKLNRKGAMIAGKIGAEHIEMANCAVFTSEDIFPSGTVTLHNMKVLSENSIDDTIIRAASLTETLNSPLTNIFKRIAGNSNITALPDSDTVKYEDRMGISGWVDNKLLFIGNRTLMEAHGIEVPSVEVDKKILRKGYFPVYLASEGKACALIVVQYSVNPEIAHELRRLTSLGVTVLVSNTDPNLSEEMICDYLGLYEDSVKVMSSAGSHMYKNTVNKVPSVSAPAAYKGNPVGFASIINCASRIKKSNLLLTVFYIMAAILGTVIFAYASFAGSDSVIGGGFILLYSLITAVISYIIYLTERP